MPFTTPTAAGIPLAPTPTGYLGKRMGRQVSDIRTLTAAEAAHLKTVMDERLRDMRKIARWAAEGKL